MNPSLEGVSLNSLYRRLIVFRGAPIRFALAFGLALSAFAFTALNQFLLGPPVGTLFAFAVILSTVFFGLAAGLSTSALSALVVDYFYLPPTSSLKVEGTSWRLLLALQLLAVCTHVATRRISAWRRKNTRPPLGISGFLDGIKDGDIFGWAFDADRPTTPVLVDIFVNKRPVAHVAAVHYRPDVASVMRCSGQHGFYVALPEHLPAESTVLVEAKLRNGASIVNSPHRFTAGLKSRRAGPTVLFVHIPKTAGTAFREAIASNYTESEIAYIYPTPPGFLVPDLRALPLDQRRSYRVVIGHFQYGMHEALPQPIEYITIVREPEARIRSQFAYLKQMQPELLQNGARSLDLAELLEKKLTVNFDNALVRCFSGVDERQFPPGTMNRDIFETAVRNLSDFVFVGHQETSSDAYAQLQNRYGWHASAGIERVNIGTLTREIPSDPALSAAIRHFNQWDFLFYLEILRRFPR